jgi:thiosulfate reductase cytochrome b subunit
MLAVTDGEKLNIQFVKRNVNVKLLISLQYISYYLIIMAGLPNYFITGIAAPWYSHPIYCRSAV